MIRRPLSRRQKALVLWAVIYLVAFGLAGAINVAVVWETAQHGPVRPAPSPVGGGR